MALIIEQIQERLSVVEKTRKAASQSCLLTWQKLYQTGSKISELHFANTWLKNLAHTKEIVPGGWYDPPPGGIGVLFATQDHPQRIKYLTLRERSNWPQPNIFLKTHGLGYIFASPYQITQDIPIIGDFGFTFYLGSDNKIRDHIKRCALIIVELAAQIKPGMSYGELYTTAIKTLSREHLANSVASSTDIAGSNIGHTIPFVADDPTPEQWDKIYSFDREKINSVISHARYFINQENKQLIPDNCAFTFEPRFVSTADSTLPMCSFHLIIEIADGQTRLLSNYSGLFNFLNINWLKEYFYEK